MFADSLFSDISCRYLTLKETSRFFRLFRMINRVCMGGGVCSLKYKIYKQCEVDSTIQHRDMSFERYMGTLGQIAVTLLTRVQSLNEDLIRLFTCSS